MSGVTMGSMTRALEGPEAGQVHCDAGLTAVFTLLGKRWSGMVLGTLLAGPARFGELASAIPGITESMLSARLSELQDAGLVSREVVPGPPVGTIYRLTEEGVALRPALTALTSWADTYLTTERRR
jgi:DNA-binding HxlR family transcriptional regulator